MQHIKRKIKELSNMIEDLSSMQGNHLKRMIDHEELTPHENRRSNNRGQNVPDMSHEELIPEEGKSKKRDYEGPDEMQEPERQMEYHKEKMVKADVPQYGNEDENLDFKPTKFKEKKEQDKEATRDVNDIDGPKIPKTKGASEDEEMTDEELKELMRRHM